MEPASEPEEVPPKEESPVPTKLSRKERIVRCFKNLANCLFPWRLRRVAPQKLAPEPEFANEEEKEIVESAVALAIKASLTSELDDLL